MVADSESTRAHDVGPAAAALLRDRPPQPFFLSVGFFETHRDFFEPTSVRDALYSAPPDGLPDTPVTRRDIAAFKASARVLDHGVGKVLSALDEADLADDTLVILTTDHGMPFPGAKSTLDRPRHRRAADHARAERLPRRQGQRRAGLADRRLPDAVRARGDPAARRICRAARCCRWCAARPRRSTTRSSPRSTYHAAYDPQRAIRTRRFKYVRRFGDRDLPVLPNIDDSPSKDLLLRHGLAERPRPREELYDLVFDPGEATQPRR